MKAEKVKEGYTVYTFETGERFRIVQVGEKKFIIEYCEEMSYGKCWITFYKYSLGLYSLKKALKVLKEKEKEKIEEMKYPIYH